MRHRRFRPRIEHRRHQLRGGRRRFSPQPEHRWAHPIEHPPRKTVPDAGALDPACMALSKGENAVLPGGQATNGIIDLSRHHLMSFAMPCDTRSTSNWQALVSPWTHYSKPEREVAGFGSLRAWRGQARRVLLVLRWT